MGKHRARPAGEQQKSWQCWNCTRESWASRDKCRVCGAYRHDRPEVDRLSTREKSRSKSPKAARQREN
eukprot:1202105-Alexandrium_andersonii.AAC.1